MIDNVFLGCIHLTTSLPRLPLTVFTKIEVEQACNSGSSDESTRRYHRHLTLFCIVHHRDQGVLVIDHTRRSALRVSVSAQYLSSAKNTHRQRTSKAIYDHVCVSTKPGPEDFQAGRPNTRHQMLSKCPRREQHYMFGISIYKAFLWTAATSFCTIP